MSFSITVSGHVDAKGTVEEIARIEQEAAEKVVVELQRFLTRIEGVGDASVCVPHLGCFNLEELATGLHPLDLIAEREAKTAGEAAAATSPEATPAATASSATAESEPAAAATEGSGALG